MKKNKPKQYRIWIKESHFQEYRVDPEIQNLEEAMKAVRNQDEVVIEVGRFEFSGVSPESEWVIEFE